MAAGFAFMNDVTVIQTSQVRLYLLKTKQKTKNKKQKKQKTKKNKNKKALCSYLIHLNLRERGVVIGHDHRHNSERFAKLSAGVFLKNNIKVYFFRKLVHTPMVVS